MARENHKPQRYRVPSWCDQICLAAHSTACRTVCAKDRQGKFFVLLQYMTIEEMPPFPLQDWIENTSPKERQIIAGAYLTKIVEAAQNRRGTTNRNDDLAEFIAGDIDSWVQAIVESSDK